MSGVMYLTVLSSLTIPNYYCRNNSHSIAIQNKFYLPWNSNYYALRKTIGSKDDSVDEVLSVQAMRT